MTPEAKPYRWVKIKNGIGSVAIVILNATPNTSQHAIEELYAGDGFIGQGYIEEVPAEGNNSWKVAARKGLQYAFSLVPNFWKVQIHYIGGRAALDTTPTIVGYTVMRAFLSNIKYELPQDQIEKLEEFVLSSWTKPYKELIPDFFTLTFTEYDSGMKG